MVDYFFIFFLEKERINRLFLLSLQVKKYFALACPNKVFAIA